MFWRKKKRLSRVGIVETHPEAMPGFPRRPAPSMIKYIGTFRTVNEFSSGFGSAGTWQQAVSGLSLDCAEILRREGEALRYYSKLFDEIWPKVETRLRWLSRNSVVGQSGLPEYALESERTCRQDHVPATSRRR